MERLYWNDSMENTAEDHWYNGTDWFDGNYTGLEHPNPFDILYIKVTFIILYSAVFTLCVIGEYCFNVKLNKVL